MEPCCTLACMDVCTAKLSNIADSKALNSTAVHFSERHSAGMQRRYILRRGFSHQLDIDALGAATSAELAQDGA